jgi:hypothetical protein
MSEPEPESGDDASLQETRERLRESIERTDGTEAGGSDGDDGGGSDGDDGGGSEMDGTEAGGADGTGDGGVVGGDLADATALLERAETGVGSLVGLLSGETEFEEVEDDVEDLQAVADEAEELLASVDVTGLAGAVDQGDLDEAVAVRDIPEAIVEGDPGEAINYAELLALVEFGELLASVDLRALRENHEELGDALAEFTADREADDDWLVFDALKAVVETLAGDSDGDGVAEEVAESAAEEVKEGASGELDVEGKAKQAAIQSKLRDATEEFRESVLDARERMQEVTDRADAEVEEKTGGRGQPSSRNPTAFSTLTSSWKGTGTVPKHSTIPESTRYSTAVGHRRLYGPRFEDADDPDDAGNGEER